MTGDVVRVVDLAVHVGRKQLLTDVALTVRHGERVGLIGESGSGKTLTALAVMGLLGEGLSVSGSIEVTGASSGGESAPPTQVIGAGEDDLAAMRGRDVTMVFQEPMTALNPTMRVGRQVAEVMTIHGTVPDRGAAQIRAVELLERVGIRHPAEAARAYPHQLSGGQRQRVVIAIALANDPSLLICDEPTTALDVTVQALVLDLIVQGVEARDAGLLFITHDLAVVASVCERVLVMYGGRVVEAGAVHEVFTRPRHRYTRGLIGASDLDLTRDDGRLYTIQGSVPPAGRFPAGCVFRNRCIHATEECHELPPWTGPGPEQGFACWHPVVLR
ncbi:MAG: dipeptide/oligopeptide/nickel ABC transporter ATP-binding protein [Actinomycetales bacterium]|nr:MAG: dipeptide/oligopeptide/nickel ABC transporter ATP-binding protein [Actinomycetales bacterium]